MSREFATREIQGKEVCSVKEAARVLGVSTVTVTKYIARGILRAIVLPSGVRQPLAEDVRTHLARNEDVPGGA